MSTTLEFLGAAGTVTGSKFLLEVAGRRLLVDCGLYQGLKELRQRNWEPLPVEPRSIDHVVLTHAHIDHSGYLPRLCRDGFRGAVHATRATADLLRILLPDSGHLQEEDAEYHNRRGTSRHVPALPLYTEEDGMRAAARVSGIRYGERLPLTDAVSVAFAQAGHILGSATIGRRRHDRARAGGGSCSPGMWDATIRRSCPIRRRSATPTTSSWSPRTAIAAMIPRRCSISSSA